MSKKVSFPNIRKNKLFSVSFPNVRKKIFFSFPSFRKSKSNVRRKSRRFCGENQHFPLDWKYFLRLSDSLTPLGIMGAIMPSCSMGFQGKGGLVEHPMMTRVCEEVTDLNKF